MDKKIQDYPHLERLATKGYQFYFSDYISKGIDIFKKDIGGFVGFTFLFFLMSSLASTIPFGSTLVTPVLMAGLYVVCRNIISNQHHEFGEFFQGFNHFGQLILVALASVVLTIIFILPLGIGAISAVTMGGLFSDGYVIDSFSEISTISIIVILGIALPIIYLSIAWSWAPMFVVFYKMQFWEAMEASRRILSKNWWIFFAFTIITGIIAFMGIFGLLVGILFTFPAAMCMHYVAFAEVVGLHHDEEMNSSIEDHLVE
ncbi:MAG: hypothetical protein AAGG68_20510 [Bacteroidota bacterium]